MILVSSILWHTWLAYLGLLGGLVAAALLKTSPLRSAAAGLVAGMVLVTAFNIVVPMQEPCLERTKGWDILRAYRVNCRYIEPVACCAAKRNPATADADLVEVCRAVSVTCPDDRPPPSR